MLLKKLALLCFAILFPLSLFAFECPKAFEEAQSMIDKVREDMKGMNKMMMKSDMALVHALLDDAGMMLIGAKHNHEKPQGPFDHGRSIAKAKSAFAYAYAADVFHWKMMQMKP